MKTYEERIQMKGNKVARSYGCGFATKVMIGKENKLLKRTEPGYRKKTTGEYVSKAYLKNFGWKNTYYQCAITEVEINEKEINQ